MNQKTLISLFILLVSNLFAQIENFNINAISLPEKSWGLELKLDGFELKENDISPKGDFRKILATNKEHTISVYIEKAPKEGDKIACRTYYWDKVKASPLSKEDIKMYEKGDVAAVEYSTEKFNGKTVNLHTLNAYLSIDGFWIDVHFSKVGFNAAKDQKVIDDLIASIKIVSPKPLHIGEQFIWAAQLFYSGNYNQAATAYEKILEPQKTSITMEKKYWYVTVDNLGMAYGVSGDLSNAKRVFEYGISLDPNYPFFYYNLACTYAEQSDIETAIKYLEQAYERKKNVIKGEELANPRTDNSFLKYTGNDSFKAFLKKHKL